MALDHIVQIGLLPQFLEIGGLLFSRRHFPKCGKSSISVILFPQVIDTFLSVLTKFAESERKDADLVAAPAEDGIDFARKEL